MKKLLLLLLLPSLLEAQVINGPISGGTGSGGSGGSATNIGVSGSGLASVVTNGTGDFTVVVTAASVGAVTSSNALVAVTSTTVSFPTNIVLRVSAKGVANGLSTIPNDGANFGPDTVGTTSSGLQEAFNAISFVNNAGPTVGGVTLELVDHGYYYFTNTLISSNYFPRAITIRGQNLLSTKMVYAGPTNVIETVLFRGAGTPRPGPSLNIPVHLTITDMGFTSITNSTNILLRVTDYSDLTIERCNFTSWQMMTNQVEGAGVSLDNVSVSGVTLGSQVGLVLDSIDGGGDHGTSLNHLYFAGLATGIYTESDHISAKNLHFAHIGVIENMWAVTTKYSLGAAILRQGGLDSKWDFLHFYSCKMGFGQLGDYVDSPLLDHANFEDCQTPVASLNTNTHAPILRDPTSGFGTDDWVANGYFAYQMSNSPNYGVIGQPHFAGVTYGSDGYGSSHTNDFFQVIIQGGNRLSVEYDGSDFATRVKGVASITSANGNFIIDANPITGLVIGDSSFIDNVILEPDGDLSWTGVATGDLSGGTGLPVTGIDATGTPGAGNFLRGDGTWAAGAGGGSPGGSDTQVQFNDGGSFGGDAGFTYIKGTDSATLVGTMTAGTFSGSGSGLTSIPATAISSLGADPNADRGVFWDDSDGSLKYFTFGSGLTMTGTTLTSDGAASPFLVFTNGLSEPITSSNNITMGGGSSLSFDGILNIDPSSGITASGLSISPNGTANFGNAVQVDSLDVITDAQVGGDLDVDGTLNLNGASPVTILGYDSDGTTLITAITNGGAWFNNPVRASAFTNDAATASTVAYYDTNKRLVSATAAQIGAQFSGGSTYLKADGTTGVGGASPTVLNYFGGIANATIGAGGVRYCPIYYNGTAAAGSTSDANARMPVNLEAPFTLTNFSYYTEGGVAQLLGTTNLTFRVFTNGVYAPPILNIFQGQDTALNLFTNDNTYSCTVPNGGYTNLVSIQISNNTATALGGLYIGYQFQVVK